MLLTKLYAAKILMREANRDLDESSKTQNVTECMRGVNVNHHK